MFGVARPASAQIKKSQHGTVSQTIAATAVTITYNRPTARGRALFGALVPYGKEWHPGADEATTITVSKDILVAGKRLPAGKYSIWAIPDPSEWTLIFSKAANVWHTPYPAGQDQLRVKVKADGGRGQRDARAALGGHDRAAAAEGRILVLS